MVKESTAAGVTTIALAGFLIASCSSGPAAPHKHGHKHEHKHGHTAAHGGSLYEVEACRTGHVEVKRDGDTITLWFVGGHSSTDRAVRVPDSEITLTITIAGSTEARPLAFAPQPIELAGETAGDCSRFTATAPWLANATAFTASGTVTFKGRRRELAIDYPREHHAPHDHDAHGEHGSEHEPHDDRHNN